MGNVVSWCMKPMAVKRINLTKQSFLFSLVTVVLCIGSSQLVLGQGRLPPVQDGGGVTCTVNTSTVDEPNQTIITQTTPCSDGTVSVCTTVITATSTSRSCDSFGESGVVETVKPFEPSAEDLNKHLISFHAPSNHREYLFQDMVRVPIKVTISPKGNVIEAKPLKGAQEPFATESANSLKGARFKPFFVKGSPVEAKANVTITFSKDGQVLSSLRCETGSCS